jgi:dolichol kinase
MPPQYPDQNATPLDEKEQRLLKQIEDGYDSDKPCVGAPIEELTTSDSPAATTTVTTHWWGSVDKMMLGVIAVFAVCLLVGLLVLLVIRAIPLAHGILVLTQLISHPAVLQR